MHIGQFQGEIQRSPPGYGPGLTDELFGIEYLQFADTGRLYDMGTHMLL